jgi:hypothetical protein
MATPSITGENANPQITPIMTAIMKIVMPLATLPSTMCPEPIMKNPSRYASVLLSFDIFAGEGIDTAAVGFPQAGQNLEPNAILVPQF